MLYGVRHGLRRLVWGLGLGLLATACVEGDGPSETTPTAVAFECTTPEGESFAVELRMGTDTATAILPGRYAPRERRLIRVRTASGAKYRGDGVVVWEKGDEARVEVDGETVSGCTRSARRSVWREARRRGVVVRAVGQEPGWVLEGSADRLHFSWDYGQRTLSVPRSAVTVDSTVARTVYRAEPGAQRLEVVVEKRPCTDVMSGESFSHTVTVTLDDDTYRGCGRFLR